MIIKFIVLNLLLIILTSVTILIFYVRNTIWVLFYLITLFILVFFLFMLVGAEYAAYMVLIIYIGAIMVLFLFVIMLLDIRQLEILRNFLKTWAFHLGAVIIFIVSFIGFLISVIVKWSVILAHKFFGNINFYVFLLFPNETIMGIGLYNFYDAIFVCLIIYLVIALLLIFFIVKQAYRIPRTLEEFRWEQIKINKRLKGDWKSFRKDIQSIINKFKGKGGGKKGKGKL